jgi:hypothetical protein
MIGPGDLWLRGQLFVQWWGIRVAPILPVAASSTSKVFGATVASRLLTRAGFSRRRGLMLYLGLVGAFLAADRARRRAPWMADALPYRLNRTMFTLRRYWAYRDDRPYFLYLRSFRDDVFAVEVDSVTRGRETTRHTLYLSQILDAALAAFGEVLFIGTEQFDTFADYGLVVKAGDADWREVVARCVRDARAVIVCPGDSPGVTEELQLLLSGALADRLILVMRPASSARERERQWTEAAETQSRGGVKLPTYLPTGALCARAGDDWAVVPLPPDRDEVRAIAEAFGELRARSDLGRFDTGPSLRNVLPTLTLETYMTAPDWVTRPSRTRRRRAATA